MKAVRAVAPAKVNWTLEVLRRREDGYHEVRSLIQTIDLHDEVHLERAEVLALRVEGAHAASDDDNALRAARLLAESTGREASACIVVRKRIPVGAGLGGGSSDAAAVLRGLNRLWGLDITAERLAETAALIGSDAPFFVYGGMALAEGRGERVTPLQDVASRWLVLLVPPFHLRDKTRRMYQALRPSDFSDGTRTQALADGIRQGQPRDDECLFNAFERAAYTVFAGLSSYRDSLLKAGALRVQPAGSGPALFAAFATEEEAKAVARRVVVPDAHVFVRKTLTAREATAVHMEQ